MSTPGAEKGWLQPLILRRFGSTKLRARSVLEGTLAGLHRSPHKGASVEFAEYKEYVPGDEIRHIDWRAYGRVDRYYVRQFEEETNTRVFLLVDHSGSMDYAAEHPEGPLLTKYEYAATMAASLAWLMLRQGDAPGLLLFADGPGMWLPPSSRRTQLDDICRVLDHPRPGQGTRVSGALQRVAEQARFRSLVVLFSDFLDEDAQMLRYARILRQRGLEVVLFHLVDPDEEALPHEGMTLYEGLEREGELLVDPDDIRSAYLEAFEAHAAQLQAECRRGDIEYIRVSTAGSPEAPLLTLLNQRLTRRGRGRAKAG